MAIKAKTKKITFSDGSTITVSEATWNISMKLSAIEKNAKESPHPDPDAQLFRLAFYPKLIACVVYGDFPSEEEARSMPETDLDKWYSAVKEMNPRWFAVIDEAITEEQQAKKKRKRQTK